MSEYSEYADKAAGVGQGKHAKGSGTGGGENAGCMVALPIPAVVVGTLLAVAVRWSRRR